MNKVNILIVSIAALLLPVPVVAMAGDVTDKGKTQAETKQAGEWSGDLILNTGTNFHLSKLNKKTHGIGDASVGLKYSKEKWSIQFTTTASYDYLFKGAYGKNTTISGRDTTSVVDASANEFRNFLMNTGVIFGWKMDRNNNFTFRYSYGLDRSDPIYYTVSDFSMYDETAKASFSRKDSYDNISAHTASISYEHLFRRGGRRLNADIRYNNSYADHFSEWMEGKGEGIVESETESLSGVDTVVTKRFRDTPTQELRNIDAGVKYTANSVGGIIDFNLDASLWLHSRYIHDRRSASTYVHGEWRDSTQARENFLYRTSVLTPTLHGTYKYLNYQINFSYSPEPYLQKLDSDGHTGDVSKGQIAHLFSVTQEYEPAKGHNLSLSFGRDESRPDYLEICWFPRQSLQYSNEVYVGNPDLKNAVTAHILGSYKYNLSKFSVSFALAHIYQHHKIEQTYSTEKIEGVDYRVYTWLNGGKSHETNGTLTLVWEGDKLKASVSGRYNMYNGTSMSGSVTKSDDWRVNASVKYSVKTWEMYADMMYNSDMVRTYNTLKSLAECNMGISKRFGRLVVSLDGKNLLDRPVETLTVSEDETEMRSETIRNNKRLIVLGLHYSF